MSAGKLLIWLSSRFLTPHQGKINSGSLEVARKGITHRAKHLAFKFGYRAVAISDCGHALCRKRRTTFGLTRLDQNWSSWQGVSIIATVEIPGDVGTPSEV